MTTVAGLLVLSVYPAVHAFSAKVAAQRTIPQKWAQPVAQETTRPGQPLYPSRATIHAAEIAVSTADAQAQRFEFSAALGILERARQQYPDSAAVLCEIGLIYLKAEDPDRAANQFNRALKIDAAYPAAELGLASVEIMNHAYEKAEALARSVMCGAGLTDADRARAHIIASRALMERGKNQQAAAEAGQALSLDRTDSEALYILAFLKAAGRQAGEARDLARQAVAADPYNIGGLRLLGQYVNGLKGYLQKANPSAESFYKLGRETEQAGRLMEARKQLERAVECEPEYYRALISLSAVCLGLGDYQPAAEWAKKALQSDADGTLAYVDLALAYTGLEEEASTVIGAPDYAARYFDRQAPKIDPSSIAKVFPEYAGLSGRQQRVVEFSIAGLADFLPILAERGAHFHLVPTDVRITDYPGYEGSGVEKTFDGRYYASIRGAGGRITLCGIESIEEAARCGFNPIAHEFAHEVQRAGMSAEQRARLRVLYLGALEHGRTLDYYSASDEYEYFAVGYEAYAAEFKRPALGVTGRHTREELKQRDPALYGFIVSLSDRAPGRRNETSD
ncbi:MAG: tetratricopeptide repeat protein [Blastocatellia bacterium]